MKRRSNLIAVVVALLLLLTWSISVHAQSTVTSGSENQIGIEMNSTQIDPGSSPAPIVRGFPFGADSPMPGFPGTAFFGPQAIDNYVSQYETLIPFKEVFTYGDAENFQKGCNESKLTISAVPLGGAPRTAQPFVRVLIPPMQPKDGAKPQEWEEYKWQLKEFNRRWVSCGTVWTRSKSYENTSDHIFGWTMMAAMKEVGASGIILKEGARLIHSARGWSIGISNNMSIANGGAGAGYGNLATGGIGFADAKVGPRGYPYIRVVGFVENPNYRPQPRPQVKKKATTNDFDKTLKEEKEPEESQKFIGGRVAPPAGR